jgi:GNAT superfamily N-acetyltransferase
MKNEAPAPVAIRSYGPEDREPLRKLVLDLHETIRPLDEDLAPGETIIDTYFEHLLALQSRTHGALFVAEYNGRLVGYVCLFGRVKPEDPDEIDRPHSYLADLYVRPDLRRSGVGARLLEKAEEFARELGVGRIDLQVVAANREAHRFYRRHGYTDRVIVMSKRLTPA